MRTGQGIKEYQPQLKWERDNEGQSVARPAKLEKLSRQSLNKSGKAKKGKAGQSSFTGQVKPNPKQDAREMKSFWILGNAPKGKAGQAHFYWAGQAKPQTRRKRDESHSVISRAGLDKKCLMEKLTPPITE